DPSPEWQDRCRILWLQEPVEVAEVSLLKGVSMKKELGKPEASAEAPAASGAAPVAPAEVPATGGAAPVADDRPSKFTMTVQGGMLEALGINMYTSIGKCL